MVMITLEGLENILKIGQQDNVKNVNPFALMVEEAYGVCVCVCVVCVVCVCVCVVDVCMCCGCVRGCQWTK